MDTESPVTETFSISRFLTNALDLFRAPKVLFRSMSQTGGYGRPILYSLLWQYVAGGVGILVSLLHPIPAAGGTAAKVAAFFFMPLMTIVAGFLFSAFFFIVWHLMGSSRNFQTAFRTWALFAPLSVVSSLLRVVPFLSMAVTLAAFVFLVVASVEVHSIRPARAWTVWSVLLVLFILLLVGVGVLNALRGGRFSALRGRLPNGGLPMGAGASPATGEVSRELQARMQAEMERVKAADEQGKMNQKKPPSPSTTPEKKETSRR